MHLLLRRLLPSGFAGHGREQLLASAKRPQGRRNRRYSEPFRFRWNQKRGLDL